MPRRILSWNLALALGLASTGLAIAQEPAATPSTPEVKPAAAAAPTSQIRQLTDKEILKAVKKKKIFKLDVREPDEIETLGTIKGYVNIPLGQLEARINEIPKDKIILTV